MSGHRPHFGYDLLDFNSIKDGLGALYYEDEKGEPDPMMSVVNADSI